MIVPAATLHSLPARAASPPSLRSPEPEPDGRVVFRLYAPHAKNVSVALEGAAPLMMSPVAAETWAATTRLAPDWYGYSFVVDGVSLVDPANPLFKPGLLGFQSLLHIPGVPPLPWDSADVPHGILHRHVYRSGVAGDDRDFYVYTPPGYDPKSARTYPVLYLLHGFSDDASAWSTVGRAPEILDHLLAEGHVQPMVVVMPLGYGAPEILAGGFEGFFRDAALRRRNFDRFGEVLASEIVPAVQRSYAVRTDRESRAIAGLSMGGAEALLSGLGAPDRFAWIGAFSTGGLDADLDAALPGLVHGSPLPPRLLWISCGVDDSLIQFHRTLHAWLDAKHVANVDVETPGGHTWMVWRRALVAFAQRLFR